MLGPLEYLIIEFKGSKFTGEIAPALAKIQKKRLISVVDLVLVQKDKAGKTKAIEVSDLPGEEAMLFGVLSDSLLNLFSQEDIEAAAKSLPKDTTAAMLLFEHRWAADFAKSLRDAGGELKMAGYVTQEDRDVLEKELAAVKKEARKQARLAAKK